MRTIVFDAPEYGVQCLVTVFDDGRSTIAFRADSHDTWGVPIKAIAAEDTSAWGADLDAGARPLPEHMRGSRA